MHNIHNPEPSPMPSSTSPQWFRQADKGRFLCLPMAAVLDRRLTQETLRVLLALALHANEHGGCFPSRGLISRLTGIHPSNVSKATRKLEKYGWLTKKHCAGSSNLYQLHIPKFEEASMDQEATDLDVYLRAHGY